MSGLQIATESIAHSVGVEPGLFEVSDLPEEEEEEEEEQSEESPESQNSTLPPAAAAEPESCLQQNEQVSQLQVPQPADPQTSPQLQSAASTVCVISTQISLARLIFIW